MERQDHMTTKWYRIENILTLAVVTAVVFASALAVVAVAPAAAHAGDASTLPPASVEFAQAQTTAIQADSFGPATVANDEISVTVTGDGSFHVETADGQDLLYGLGTSYLTVKVDGTNYTTDSMSPYITQESTVVGNDTIVTEWVLPGDVFVRQTLSIEGKLAKFDVEIENRGDQSHDVGVRYLFDYQIEALDGSPIFLEGTGVITHETRYDDPSFDGWKTYGDVPNPDLTGQAKLATQPDTVKFVSWPRAASSPYEYDINPDVAFFDLETETGDSAGLLYWNLGSIAPGSAESVSTLYGLGEPGTAAEQLSLQFDDQESNGETVTVASVFLPDGGFIAIENEAGDIIGVSDYLSPGQHNDITITLDPPLTESQTLTAVPHLDTNDNQAFDFLSSGGAEDGPYTDAEGNPITDSAEITLPGQQNTLRVEGSGEYTPYSFSADESVSLNGEDPEDEVTGSTAYSAVGADNDTYTFEGDLTDLYVGGSATVYVNDEQVDPSSIGSDVRSITFKGTGSYASYEFTVSGAIKDGIYLDQEDFINGSQGAGAVRAGAETYFFTGDLNDLSVGGNATVYVNGEKVDPSSIGPDVHSVTFRGTGSYASYEFTVSGTVQGGIYLDQEDSFSGSHGQGAVTAGPETYFFTGTLENITTEGDVTVIRNDEEAS